MSDTRSVLATVQRLTPDHASLSTNLILWLDATSGVFSDAGATLAVNNNTVQQWNDRSLNLHHALQGTAGDRPTYKTNILNGLPGILFSNAGNEFLSIASNSVLTVTNDITIIVVAMPKNMKLNDGQGLVNYDLSGTHIYGLYCSSKGQIIAVYTSSGPSIVAKEAGMILPLDPQIITEKYDRSTVKIFQNGGEVGSASKTGNLYTTGSGSLHIGKQKTAFTTRGWDGYICEIAMYNKALSDAERYGVEAYLGNKWGINTVTNRANPYPARQAA